MSIGPTPDEVRQARLRLNRSRSDAESARKRLAEATAALRKAEQKLRTVLQARDLAQRVAEAVQTEAHRQVADVVGRCLETVFGDRAYRLRIAFERKRGKTEARLQFVRDGLVLDEPLRQGGGGQVDVAAFALRLSALLLAQPRKRKLLVLDEPFRNLHGEQYEANVGGMLLALARDLGVQIVMATDEPWLEVGTVIRLGEGGH